MTTTLQLSDKRGDAILLVKTEANEINQLSLEQAEASFAAAVGLVGLGPAYEAFGAAPPATIPAVQQLIHPQQPPAPEPWGQPPVPPMPAAAQPYAQPQPQQYQQAPQQQAPVCQHGVKLYKTGKGKNPPYRDWAAWFCPAPGTDPTQCAKEWIR